MSDPFTIKLAQVNPHISEVTLATAAVILCPDVILLDQLRPASTGLTLSFSSSVAPLSGRIVRIQTI